MEKEILLAAFQDTLSLSQGILGESTAAAATSGAVYREGFSSTRMFAMVPCRVEVLACGIPEAAAQYARKGRTALINAGNPHFPGGGVGSGARGQEENLCRRSNLFPCLADEGMQEDFYRHHREHTDYFFSDRVMYHKGVTIFKDGMGNLLSREKWLTVDVLTCAAPYIAKRRYTNRAALEEIIRNRIRNVLEVSIHNRVEVLVFGAFGCGAFGNPPEVAGRAFRQVLTEARYQGAFRNVVFAIEDGAILRAFSAALAGETAPDHAESAELVMPGGRTIPTEAMRDRYFRWRRENPRFGKQFSVLGDSISTLEGYLPRGYRTFYQGQVCEKTGVREMEDTWWGKVIGFFGGELLVNNAWPGSTVAQMAGQKEPFPSGCSPRRTGSLHLGTVMPDVILVYLGMSDWAKGITPEAVSGGDTVFAAAYGHMLADLRRNYPGAEIWCCTLAGTYMQSNPSFSFPSAYGGFELDAYNHAIRRAAQDHGCRLVDIGSLGLPYDTVDGTHPTVAGMNTLAMLVLRCTAGESGGMFLDCDGGRHENVELPAREDGYHFVCRRCGRQHILPYSDREHIRLFRDSVPELNLVKKKDGSSLKLRGTQLFAGRSGECDLRLFGDYAARYQAEFLFRDGAWYLRDNQSKNGTYLNGARLAPDREVRLKPGDEIAFAKMETVTYLG